jgi:hypothetical protein
MREGEREGRGREGKGHREGRDRKVGEGKGEARPVLFFNSRPSEIWPS